MEPRNATLPVVRIADIATEDVPRRWLIEGLWGAAAVGIIGGAPKCCKSWLGLEMSVSVATGTPCLGRYRVLDPGPVLIYLAEDALGTVRSRVAGLLRHRGVNDLRALEIYAITVASLRLDRAGDRERLFETARRLRPRLLLLDPLVRLHALNENDAGEVAQLLSYIRGLQRQLDLSVVLVHHSRKHQPAGVQAGQGLRGSGDLHAFGDSNLYLRRRGGDLILSMEHRAAAAPEPVALELVTAAEDAIHLAASGTPVAEAVDGQHRLEEEILRALDEKAVLNRTRLRDLLSVNNDRLGRTLLKLEAAGKVRRDAEGWSRTGS
jgi:hypothetical protein